LPLSIVALPFAVPVLPVDRFVRYERALGQTPEPEEHEPLGDLPQYYADMFGWCRGPHFTFREIWASERSFI
jgi:hypothetical protein